MRLRTRIAAVCIAALSVVAITAATAGAQITYLGSGNFDYAGHTFTTSGTTCTITAGNPVVSASSGVRQLQATSTITCNRIVNFHNAQSALRSADGVSWATKRAYASSVHTGQSVTMTIATPCRNITNTSYATNFMIMIDVDRDGIFTDNYHGSDWSVHNLRSCGI
jgi:hypothetical protein